MVERHTKPHSDIAGYLLGTLQPKEATEFGAHLPDCAPCRGEVEQLGTLPALLARFDGEVDDYPDLPSRLEERTFAAIEAAAASEPAAPDQAAGVGVAPPHAAGGRPVQGPPPIAPVVSIDRGARRRGPLAGRRRVLVAVAAVLVAIAAATAVVVSRRHTAAPALAVVQLVSPGGETARGTAVIHAVATGLRIDLTVQDLPDTPAGRFDTCWLVGPGDTLTHPNRVAVGSFIVRGQGALHLQWDTAASLARFPALGVTSEPDNGNPSHQGPKLLASV